MKPDRFDDLTLRWSPTRGSNLAERANDRRPVGVLGDDVTFPTKAAFLAPAFRAYAWLTLPILRMQCASFFRFMQVYSNILRFPAPEPAPAPMSHRATPPEPRDNVVAFARDSSEEDRVTLDLSAQQYGQLYLAQRMSARAVAEFDAVSAL